MKLLCSVSIGNRNLSTTNINPKRRHVKSTLALCKKLKSDEFCLIHFTDQNKNGTRYEIKDNILNVLTKFVNEGKTTIQFKVPAHDLYIQADTIQLKGFLHLLRNALEKKVSGIEMNKYSSLMVQHAKKVAPTKLVIGRRSDYPIRGLPRTLEELRINDIQRYSLDRGILNLIKLKILDLSNNCIECLPEEFCNLPCLNELNISKNQFYKSSPKQWSWICGNIAKNLKLLNVSHNRLKFLPEQLVKLHSLISLHVDNNELKMFPSGIGNLKNLRIVTASNNRISSLPGSVKKWKLQHLDLSNNSFDPNYQSNPAAIFPKPLPVCMLKELAARKVLYEQLFYSPLTLPRTVIHFMDLAKYCTCGKACFSVYISHTHMLSLSSITQSFSISLEHLIYVPIECYFCSLKCFGTANYKRPFYFVTR